MNSVPVWLIVVWHGIEPGLAQANCPKFLVGPDFQQKMTELANLGILLLRLAGMRTG
jgi:hypothetical protein